MEYTGFIRNYVLNVYDCIWNKLINWAKTTVAFKSTIPDKLWNQLVYKFKKNNDFKIIYKKMRKIFQSWHMHKIRFKKFFSENKNESFLCLLVNKKKYVLWNGYLLCTRKWWDFSRNKGGSSSFTYLTMSTISP